MVRCSLNVSLSANVRTDCRRVLKNAGEVDTYRSVGCDDVTTATFDPMLVKFAIDASDSKRPK